MDHIHDINTGDVVMDWKHLASLALGVGCVIASALIPATAPYLLPAAVPLLVATNVRKVVPAKKKMFPG